jgi:hypothetical protein
MEMSLTNDPPKVFDEVITEVRAIKRGISERHGNDIDRLLESLISQECNAEIKKRNRLPGSNSLPDPTPP